MFRWYFAKAAKHEAVHVLASAKLNTVNLYISKALDDGKISDEEYWVITREVEKYCAMKDARVSWWLGD